jgi:hypothetical protein
MKQKLILLFGALVLFLSGCGGSGSSTPGTSRPPFAEERGGFTVAYDYPLDTDHVEMFVSTVPNFNPTGYDPSVYDAKYLNTPGYVSGTWANKPNDVKDWNGVENNLYSTHPPIHRIEVNGLTVGKTYYYKTVVVDKAGQRSIPSPEITVKITNANTSWFDDFNNIPYDRSIWAETDELGNAVNNTAVLTLEPSEPNTLSINTINGQSFSLCSTLAADLNDNIKDKLVYEARIKIQQPTANARFRLGLFYEYVNNKITDGYSNSYEEFSQGTDLTKIVCYSYAQSGSHIVCNSTKAVAFTWGVYHVLKVEYVKSTQQVNFYIDDVLVHTGNGWSGSQPRAILYQTSTDDFTIDIDYANYRCE